ncbi:hypothetical protein GCM10027190_06760 [Spirosoma areae]
MAELQKQYPKGYPIEHYKFIDSSQSIMAEWWFDTWENNMGNHDPKSQPHGVVIFLKDKGNQLDSVKTALEQQYKQSLEPLEIHKLKGDFTKINPPIYVCHINEGTILVLTKGATYRDDPWSQKNSLRISIGYNLSQKNEEFFALLGGDINKDKGYD